MGYDPYVSYGSGVAEAVGGAGIMLFMMMVYYLLAFGFSILCYVMFSLGMYTIAQRRGINHPWLAWVPFGNMWILGSISDQYQYVSQGQVKSRRKLLLGLQIALSAALVALMCICISLVVQAAIMGWGDLTYMLGDSLVPMVLVMVLLCLAVSVIAILLLVFEYICFYNLYASCEPNNKTIYLLLSIFIGVTMPFLVFACRKKDLGMPPRRQEPVYHQPEYQPIDPPTYEE